MLSNTLMRFIILFLAPIMCFSQLTIASLNLTKEIEETSGLEIYGNDFITHNDSGDKAKVYIFNSKGEMIRSVRFYDLKSKDWEDIAADATHYYIADTGNNRIQKWEFGGLTGTTVAGGNGFGKELNQLHNPFGIAVDNAGAIYVSELSNLRVTKWNAGGSEGEIVAGGNGEGSDPDQLAIPMGIAVNKKGDLFVADTYNHRVQLWEKGATKGKTLISGKDFEPAYQTNYFSGISIVGDSFLYITDYQQKRIIRYHIDSDTFEIISTNNSIVNEEDELSQPYQTAVDLMGDLIIADAKNNRIQKRKIKNE